MILWGLLAALAAHAAAQTWLLLAHQPLGADLLPDWTAGRIAFTAPRDLYRFDVVTRLQAWAIGDHPGPRPYLYPPSALILFGAFARLPFAVFYPLWTSASAAVLGWAAWRRLARERWLSLALLAATSGCLMSVLVGQASLLIAGLILWGVGQLRPRPLLAGALLAAAALIKPTSLLLLPVALVAAGRWRALAAAAATVLAGVLLSSLMFGWRSWLDWLGAAAAFGPIVENEPSLWRGVINFTWLAHLLGAGELAVLALRVLFAAGGVALVWRVFRRCEDPEVRVIALVGASLLITPYAMFYDAAILAGPSLILMSRDQRPLGRGLAAFLLAELAANPPVSPLGLLGLIALFSGPFVGWPEASPAPPGGPRARVQAGT